MNYALLKELFEVRFPAGTFSSLDFRRQFGGFGHSIWVAVEPIDCADATRSQAFARLDEIIDFLRSQAQEFARHDRIQFAIGFSESVKKYDRRILRGWISANRLSQALTRNFAAYGGALTEFEGWSEGVQFRPRHDFECL
jgi:hypothetical protein